MAQRPSNKRACPTCFKTDEDDIANCLNKPLNMCPKSERIADERAVEIVCAAPCGGPQGKHLACPIGNIMKRRQLTNLGSCAFDVCRARVVHPTTLGDKLKTAFGLGGDEPVSGE